MPAVIDYKPIANGGGAFVLSQADYVTDLGGGGILVNGMASGILAKEVINKVVRQSSVMTAALATFLANTDGLDVLDDGVVATLATRIATVIAAVAAAGAWSTGDYKLTIKTAADAGWILCDDGTVGDATSGATHASAANQALFLLLWTNIVDAWAPVAGGRGASAAADWAAHKKISLTRMLGRALSIAGAGSGLTARALGQYLGAETATLITGNLPSHAHGVNDPGHAHGASDAGHAHVQTSNNATDAQQPTASGPSVGAGYATATQIVGSPAISTQSGNANITVASAVTGITIQNTGSGDAFAIMNPAGFTNIMVKL